MTGKYSKVASLAYTSADFDSDKPLMVVCGFADGKIQFTQKYADLYQDMGFRVLILQSTFFDFLVKPKSWVHWSSYQATKDKIGSRVSFHIMSNGGARSFCCFEDHFKSNFKPLEIELMIIDSCPTLEAKTFPGTKFFVSWLPNIVAKVLDIVLIPFLMGSSLWSKVNPKSSVFYQQRQRLLCDLKVPKLFLYSQADLVVPACDIEEAIDIARVNGSKVESVDFKDSLHVQHFRMHPNKYTASIKQFLIKYLCSYSRAALF